MEPLFTKLIAVASGTKAQILHWSKALSADSIEYFVVQPHCDMDPDSRDYWELWVDGADVTRARAGVRAASREDASLLW